MNDYASIDLSDIPEVTSTMKAVRNPFYERVMKNGFTVTEYYSPEDISKITKGTLARRIDMTTLDPEEQEALERYNKTQVEGRRGL
jgi:hypothetical protein